MNQRMALSAYTNRRAIRTVCLAALLAFGATAMLPAQQLTIVENISIAPYSIPVPSAGGIPVGMTRVTVRPSDSYSYEITQIVVQATSSGAFQDGWVDSIEVYWEGPSGNAEYDHGALIDDQLVSTGGPYSFSGGTATIAINDSIADMPENTQSASRQLYVVYNLNSSADPSLTLGCEVTSITYDRNFLGLFNSTATVYPTAHNGTQPMDRYDTTMDAVWIGPATAKANGSKVGLLRLDFDVTDATATTYVDAIKLTRTYGLDSYVATGGVLLFADLDGDGDFEPDGDDGTYIASGSLGSDTVTLDPASNPAVTSAGRSFFVAVTFDTTADQRGQSFGLGISNPSTDITFADELEDDDEAEEYAYVFSGREYVQVAPALSSTDPDPPVNPANSVEIDYPDDGAAPSVLSTTPENAATQVARAANLSVVFSEWMDEASAENAANFELTAGGPPLAVTAAYNDVTKTLTLNPNADLVADTTYTATVKSTMTDYYGNAMAADYVWSFRTVDVYPTVLSTYPESDAEDIPRSAVIAATFSENVFDADSSFSLEDGLGNSVGAASIVYDPGTYTVTFTPASSLAYSTTYTATISTDVYDSDLLHLQSEYVWSFTTLNPTPPRVESVSPADGATGVAVGSTIQATFSKPVDEDTLDGNFTVVGPAGAVSGTITYDPATYTATFTPSSPLSYLASYSATVTSGVTDIEDTALSPAPKIWSFTTFGFDKPTVTNNRIVSGGNQEVLIFVPQPPPDNMKVQVFTTTGRLVRTFSADEVATSPVPWNGTNGRGQPLGPGMYFVQIQGTGYKEVLKVLIVR